MAKVTILLSNSVCKLSCDPATLELIVDKFKIRVPGAFYSDAFRSRRWDGFNRFVKDNGTFPPGLLNDVVAFIKTKNIKIKIIDHRDEIIRPDEIQLQLGDLVLRGYQKRAVKAFFNHTVLGYYHPQAILKEATNAGKNLISASIMDSYPEGTKCLFLIHSKLIFRQAKKELGELLGTKRVGTIDSNGINPRDFTIGMIQTIHRNLGKPEIKRVLASTDVLIVDECHRAPTVQYEKVLAYLYNCSIRLGMSGSPLSHKDKIKNQKVVAFFGPIIHEVKNLELVEKGFSTKPKIRVVLGETSYRRDVESYKQEYDEVITYNKKRNKMVWRRVSKKLKKGKLPLMIFCKYIDHTKQLVKLMPKDIKAKYRVAVIHNKVKNREKVLDDFKVGKYDILIATHLIKEGQNMPLIKYAINCGGGDSLITVIQWLGRMLRTHKSKKYVYIEDIFDLGKYLKRHSKHRVKYLKAEGFEIKETYKKTAKRKSIKIY